MQRIINDILEWCQNDMNYLQELINSLQDIVNNAETESKRKCSECGKDMNQGYCIENGEAYYCSDECLHKHMTNEEYLKLYDNGNGDIYYTEWED